MLIHLAASIGGADPESHFSAGTKSFRANNLEAAANSFLSAEAASPLHADALLNLGLIAFKERRVGAALGIWRKGLRADPTNSSLFSAVQFAESKLEKRDLPREFTLWERYREAVLLRLSTVLVLWISAFLLLGSGWLWLKWAGHRRRAIEEESAGPPTPVGAIVLSVLFLTLVSILISIYFDRLDSRGTIVAAKVAVLTAPELEATALFEISEGLEVIVRESRNIEGKTWRRITYPGGLSGWVTANSVFTTSDPVRQLFKISPSEAKP